MTVSFKLATAMLLFYGTVSLSRLDFGHKITKT